MIFKLITYLTLIVAVLFGFSCKCDKQAEKCTRISDFDKSIWVDKLENQVWKYVNEKDSTDTKTYYTEGIDSKSEDHSPCKTKMLGGCECGSCEHFYKLNIYNGDDRGKVVGIYNLNKLESFVEHIEGKELLWDVNFLNCILSLDVKSREIETGKYQYIGEMSIGSTVYKDVYKILRPNNVNDTSLYLPGFVFVTPQKGILRFQDHKTLAIYNLKE